VRTIEGQLVRFLVLIFLPILIAYGFVLVIGEMLASTTGIPNPVKVVWLQIKR
jgi:hypothetical protein